MFRHILFSLFIFVSFSLEGEILESGTLSSVLPFAEKDTLIIFDIDNTLIESSIQMGSAQWRNHIRAKAKEAGFDAQESEEILDRFWVFAQSFVPVRLVDQAALSTLDKVRSKTLAVALTAREPEESVHTKNSWTLSESILKMLYFLKPLLPLFPSPAVMKME